MKAQFTAGKASGLPHSPNAPPRRREDVRSACCGCGPAAALVPFLCCGTNNVVTNATPAAQKFYRLSKP